MADTNANININIDTSQALASIKSLQSQISKFQADMASSGAASAQAASKMQQNLINSVNATKTFGAEVTTIRTTTESFTNALEKNKLSLGQTFKFAGASTKTFGRLFKSEFSTINKVARERVKDLQTQYVKLGRNASGAMQAIKIRPLALDMDNLGTRTALAAQKQQLFNQLLRQGSTNLLNFGKNTQWAGRQLMVGFTIPLAMFGTAAAREFKKIEEQAIKFRRVYGDMFTTDTDTEKALSNVRELAEEFTKYGIAVEKTVDLGAKIAQMGNVGDALEAQIIQATRLSVLGGIEQMEALDTTISLTNAFKIEIKDLANEINFLNAAENQTILAIDDFNTAIPLAGSVIRQLGGDVQDLAVLLTAMREGGINASQGGNALKSSLARLIAPSRNATETMGAFGIDVLGIVNSNAGDLMGTIRTLAFALDELDPLSRARGIEALFGKFQFARMSTLLQNITDQGSQANKVLGLTANSAEELAILADRELGKVEASASTKFEKSLEKLRASLAPIGEAFVKLVTPLVEFFTKILENFNNLSDGAKGFIVGITGLLGLVAPAALMVVGLIANGVANLLKFFALIGRGMAGATGSTKVLSDQTAFMNQEQIEAAAVAASLDQVHSKLIQTFTSEAGAINNLTIALQRAVNAQNAFRASAAGASMAGQPKAKFAKGRMPKGYNGGVMMVPGPKGAGDIIPAMVSPGEAIIPAAMTSRYAPLISAMIDGKIPGYNEGFDPKRAAARLIAPRGGQTELSPMWERSVRGLTAEIEKLSGVLGPGRVAEKIAELGDASFKTAGEAKKSAQMQALENEKRASNNKMQFAHVTPDVRMSAADAASRNFSGQSGDILKEMAAIPALAKREIRLQSGFGVDMLQENNLALASSFSSKGRSVQGAVSAAADPSNIFKDLSEGGSQRWMKAFKVGGLDTKNITPEIQEGIDAFNNRVVSGVKAAADNPNIEKMFDTDAQIDELAKQAPKQGVLFDPSRYTSLQRIEEEAAKGMDENLKLIREKAKNTVSDFRLNISKTDQAALVAADRAGDPDAAGSENFFRTRLKNRKEGELRESKSVDRRLEGGIGSFDEKKQAVLDQQVEEFNDSAQDTAKTKSESRRTRQIAKDTVDGYANELERGKSKVADAGQVNRKDLAAQSRQDLYGDGPVDSAQKSMRRKVEQQQRDAQRQQKVVDKQNRSIYGTDGFTPSMRLERKRMEAMAKLERAKIAQQKQLIMQEQAVSRQATQEIQKQNILIRTKNRVLALKDRILNREMTQSATEGGVLARRGMGGGIGRGGMMGVGALATTGVMMAAGQQNAVGEMAQKAMPAVMAMSMLPVILPLLTNPITALVAVIAAAAVGIMLMNAEFKKTQKEAIETSRALGSSSDALNNLAEFSGSVTGSQFMDRRREDRLKMVSTAPGKTSFGEAFMKNEQGESMLEAARKQIAIAGSQSVVNSLTSQLSSAIISGALSADQASSLAANLSHALGDMTIGIKVRANIVSLVGPGGEELTGQGIVDFSARQNAANLQDVSSQLEMFNKNVRSTPFGTQTSRNIATGAAAAGGGVGGAVTGLAAVAAAAKIGAKFGVVLGPKGMVIGAVAGAIIGGIAAVAAANSALKETADQTAAMSGAVVGTVLNATDAQRAANDALDAYYLKKIDEAKVQGDIAEALRLQGEHEEKKLEISKQAMALRQNLREALAAPGADRGAIEAGIEAAIEIRFKDDGPGQISLKPVQATLDRLEKKGLLGESGRVSLDLALATDLSPVALNSLLALVEEDESQVSALVNIVGNFGGTFAEETQNILGLVEDRGLRAQLLIDIAASKNSVEAEEALDFIREIGKQGEFINVKTTLEFFSKNSQAQNDLQQIFKEIDAGGVTTIERAIEIDPRLVNPDVFDEVYFDTLSLGDKEQYVKTISMILSMPPAQLAPELERWLSETGPAGGASARNDSLPTQLNKYAQSVAFKVTTGMPSFDTSEVEPTEPTGTGGKKEDPFEDMLKRLKNVRDSSINAAGGAKELLRVLGKGKDIRVFSGIQQQLIGLGKGFSDYIAGLKKETRDLFVTINKGGKVSLTNLGKAMQKAFIEAEIGDFQLNLVQSLDTLKKKENAYGKLRKMGLDYADAIQIATNETLALAIATGKIKGKELREVIRLVRETRERNERDQAFEGVRKAIADFAKDSSAKAFIKLNFPSMQQDAILNDETLMAMAKLGLHGAAEFKQRLEQVMGTIEFKQGVFDKGFGMAMEAFAAKEKEIDIRFTAKKDPYTEIIRKAEEDLSDIRNRTGGLDNLEADLERISVKEDDINKTYDARLKALDQVDKANAKIAQRQKQQLTIADALSQGDIAAAARAIQEQRAQEAADASQNNRDLLERSRELQLARVTGSLNLTREQIESRVKDLKKEIFNIEQDRLIPAQRQVELLERAEKAEIKSLTVLEKTRAEWEKISNGIELAKTSSKAYEAAIQAALDVVSDILKHWNEIEKPKTTVHTIVTNHSSSGSPAPATPGTGSPAGRGGTRGTGAPAPDTGSPAGGGGTSPVRQTAQFTKAQIEAQERATARAQVTARNQPIAKRALASVGAPARNDPLGISKIVPPSVMKTVNDWGKGVQTSIVNWAKSILPRSKPTTPAPKPNPASASRAENLRFARMSVGGSVARYAVGGGVKKYADGGFAMGTDIVPAMLTPGEFVVRKYAVESFGADRLKAINKGAYSDGSVYNYNLSVSVKSEADPDRIAKTVISQIKQVDSMRIRSNRI